eukprot:COSAG02_NODE_3058_length_7451_cov_47.724701_9_plen_290_part_00
MYGMNIDLRLAIVAAATHLAAGQETGSTDCPCVTTTSWLAGATATSGGSQILQSSVGTVTTVYPITYGLDGCQAYSATSSPSCVDLDTGVELVPLPPSLVFVCFDAAAHLILVFELADHSCLRRSAFQTRRPAWCEDKWCYVDGDNCEVAGGAITSTLFPGAYLSYQTCASAATSTNTYEHLTENGGGVTELTGIVENYLYASAAEAERVATATSTAGYQTCDASMACPYALPPSLPPPLPPYLSLSLSVSLSLSLCISRCTPPLTLPYDLTQMQPLRGERSVALLRGG